jgi:GTP-binding protein
MNKRVIVADSRRSAKADQVPETRGVKPQPLLGAEFVLGAAQASQLPPAELPEIAFAGRSNAGKSSAINALATRSRLAFASRTPGRTQQINLFSLRGSAMVADLPGYGYAAVGRDIKRGWQDFLWQYLTTRPTLAALVLLVDARHGLKEPDRDVLQAFVPSGRPLLLLATKADKLGTTAQRQAAASIAQDIDRLFPLGAANVTIALFSAVTRLGVEQANTIIAGWVPAGGAV